MSTPCLLLIDPPGEGAWNMAVDEALLERALGGEATLRFYQWREPTLSLGYSQRLAERTGHAASQTAPAVRRLSGGGALLHDRELTYSLCLPANSPWAQRASDLYRAVHESLIEVLAHRGVAARLHEPAFPPSPLSAPAAEPFLCFARRGANDVVVPSSDSSDGLTKIVGSAQRRSRGAVLQHGALLLAQSRLAPELPGVRDLTNSTLFAEELAFPCSALVAERLKLRLSRAEQAVSPWHEAAQRLVEKYAGSVWTARR